MKKIPLYVFAAIALLVAVAAYAGRDISNKFTLGDGTASNKVFEAKRSSGTNPKFQWTEGSSKWQFSNDGVSFSDFGGTGGLNVSGTSGSPNNITAAGGITFTAGTQRMLQFIQGNGGDIDITANPQIQAGTIVGQEFKIIGRNSSQRVLIEDGNGLALKSKFNMGANDEIDLVWNGSLWVETSRTKKLKHIFVRVDSVCAADPCTITDQGGDVTATAVNKETGSARYSVNFATGTWNSATTWACSVVDNDNVAGFCSGDVVHTATKWEFACYTSVGVAQDSSFALQCSGY